MEIILIVVAVLLALAMMTIAIQRNRDTWFRRKTNVGDSYAPPTQPTTPPQQPTAAQQPQQQGVATPSQPQVSAQPSKPTWNFFKFAFVVVSVGVLFYVVLGNLRYFLPIPSSTSQEVAQTTSSDGSLWDATADQVLPVVCGCESSGVPGKIQYFEKDGTTPLRNKRGSSAISGCQILADAHERRAKEKFDLDIRTQQGNWEYAKILYNESGTQHWEGTPGNTTRSCWEPELMSRGYRRIGRGGQLIQTLTIEAPINGWSEVRGLNPGQPAHFFGNGKKYRVLWNGTVEEDLPREEGVASKTPSITTFFQVKSREDEPVQITIIIDKRAT